MRLIPAFVPAFTLAAALLAGAAPLSAQSAKAEDSSNTISAVIVYGKDECPKPVGDEITICARKPEAERYRIPQGLRDTPSTTAESWNSRVMAYERVGKTGTLSCTPTGPGGWTGCSQQLIDRAYAEKHGGEDLQFGKIIQQERAKRLSTVDADAAATQARVEQAEKDYDARQRAEAEAAEKAAQATPVGK
ncbi:MAG: hypothetical protein RLZZ136_521 [Pseudomonadota bacterium]